MYGFGLSLDYPQKGACCALRTSAALLPVLKSIQFETETRGEFRLRQPELADAVNAAIRIGELSAILAELEQIEKGRLRPAGMRTDGGRA